jgi:arylsulfatase
MLDFAAVRPLRPLLRPSLVAFCLLLVGGLLASCRHRSRHPTSWARTDLWQLSADIEEPALAHDSQRPYQQRITTLGAAEVRDMSRVPEEQRLVFPHESGGQIRALETRAPSRLRWKHTLGEGAYFSFIPLGTATSCPACIYRMGLRLGPGRVVELYRSDVQPVPRFAPATVEVDLSPYAGQDADVLIALDGGGGSSAASALWGSPALYERVELPTPARPPHPNVVVIGIDTLRADELGPWGRTPTLTPAIDKFAAQSDVWLDAYSVFNVTNPSFVSIMTGLYGKGHGVYDLHTPLPAAVPTLATLYHQAGYATLAVISARHLGNHNSGLGVGFDDVTTASEHLAGELATDMAFDWIASRSGRAAAGQPFFVWLHLWDPHTPHTPPEPYASGLRPGEASGLTPARVWLPFRTPGKRDFTNPVLAGDRDLYDGQVAYVDRQVGRLLDALESRGLLDNTIIALVADHGENLGDHGFMFQHVGLFETTTRVPMMIRWPAAAKNHHGQRFRGLVETIDLFPTLLAASRLPVPPCDGKELRAVAGNGKAPAGGRAAVFAEHSDHHGSAVRTVDYRYVVNRGNPFIPDGVALYDEHADPAEAHNLAGQGLPAEGRLAQLLAQWQAAPSSRHPQAQSVPLSKEEALRLQALGYGTPGGTAAPKPPN